MQLRLLALARTLVGFILLDTHFSAAMWGAILVAVHPPLVQVLVDVLDAFSKSFVSVCIAWHWVAGSIGFCFG